MTPEYAYGSEQKTTKTGKTTNYYKQPLGPKKPPNGANLAAVRSAHCAVTKFWRHLAPKSVHDLNSHRKETVKKEIHSNIINQSIVITIHSNIYVIISEQLIIQFIKFIQCSPLGAAQLP